MKYSGMFFKSICVIVVIFFLSTSLMVSTARANIKRVLIGGAAGFLGGAVLGPVAGAAIGAAAGGLTGGIPGLVTGAVSGVAGSMLGGVIASAAAPLVVPALCLGGGILIGKLIWDRARGGLIGHTTSYNPNGIGHRKSLDVRMPALNLGSRYNSQAVGHNRSSFNLRARWEEFKRRFNLRGKLEQKLSKFNIHTTGMRLPLSPKQQRVIANQPVFRDTKIQRPAESSKTATTQVKFNDSSTRFFKPTEKSIKVPESSGKNVKLDESNKAVSFKDSPEAQVMYNYKAAYKKYVILLQSGRSTNDPAVKAALEEYKKWHKKYQSLKK